MNCVPTINYLAFRETNDQFIHNYKLKKRLQKAKNYYLSYAAFKAASGHIQRQGEKQNWKK